MVDPQTLATILNNLRDYLGKLAILAAFPQEAFTQDFTKVESAKHYHVHPGFHPDRR